MPNILVRDVNKTTIKKLKARAKLNGRSLQTEVKEIVEKSALEMTHKELRQRAGEYRKRFEGSTFVDSVELLREDRAR